jgi:4-amino-4-deoxy-L-arabinose transferase-like glycosyltransferase
VTARHWIAFFVAICVLALGTLDMRPLYKADESRYAEIPREMVARGDWVTPYLNEFKYFEKPPLQYWATAAFFTAFGQGDWVARLWTALLGLAGLIMTVRVANRLRGPPAGPLAAAVLAGCPLYVLLIQVNTLDMGLAFFLSAAMFAFALGHFRLFWAACALAVLSKGLVGIVLPLGAVGAYLLLKRDFSLIARMRPVTGPLIFLAISAPWFVAVSLANAEFAHFFFIQEHFQRFTTRMHGRYQPAWYFIPILAFGLAPWLLLLGSSLKAGVPANLLRKSAFDPKLFLLVWVVLLFAFFSASSSKLPSYVLPMFPPLAVLLGCWLADAKPGRLLAVQAALAAAAGLGFVVLASQAQRFFSADLREQVANYTAWLAAGGLALAFAGGASAWAAWRGRLAAAVALLAFGSFTCTLAAMVGHRAVAIGYSMAPQAAALGPLPAGARVFAVDFYDHTMPWFLGRSVTMVRYKDELGEPIKWEPQKFIADLPEFERAWNAAPAAYAIFSSAKYENLRKELTVPMEPVSRGPRYTIVRKP